MIFVPGLIASLMAILIEKKGRRSTLALYMTNLVSAFLHKNNEVPLSLLSERGRKE